MEIKMKKGNYYLVHERKPRMVFEVYDPMRNAGMRVVCVSRIHPDQLRDDFGIAPEDTLWLSNTPGERNINPMNVGILTDRLIRFYEKGSDSVVLLEGLEYLATQNDFDKVLRLINYLYEAVSINKTLLVVSIDPRAFNSKELAFLERSAVVINEGDSLVMGF